MDRPKQWDFIEQALDRRRRENRLRRLHPVVPAEADADADADGDAGGSGAGEHAVTILRDGRRLINFSSNDYLGLSRHPALAARAAEYAGRYGAGSTASRMICGTYDIHDRLERKIADAFGTEAALVFNSGFQANSTLLRALTDRNSLILADKLSHNSLLQGALLSRATFRRFEHNDLEHLEHLLQQASSQSYDRILVVTETVFSMDGDRCDLDAIIALSDRYDTLLYVDDAHAVGVWGRNGLGFACGRNGIDLTLGTFGKAFGVFGAFVTCSARMRDYLVNFCPGFIYTTALPPPVIGALDAALDLVPGLDSERDRFHAMIADVRGEIEASGFRTGPSSTQIIPVIIGSEEATLELSQYLDENGILATAIRPPTVPDESSRIRITLSSKHTREHTDQLVTALRSWHEQHA